MKINEINSSYPQAGSKINHRQMEDPEKMLEACRQFEAVFINMMLKQMRSTIGDGGLTQKSQGREIFESMYDEKLSEEMSKGQGIGLAKELYLQLTRNQRRRSIKEITQE